MVAADRRHPDDVPIQQLEPVVLTEDARLGRPVEFVHAERPLSSCVSMESSVSHARQPCLHGQNLDEGNQL